MYHSVVMVNISLNQPSTKEEYMSEELITNFRKLAGSMSYYNAAEGDWSREADARNDCRKKLIGAADKLREAGIDPGQYEGQFLISSGDYTDYSLKAIQ